MSPPTKSKIPTSWAFTWNVDDLGLSRRNWNDQGKREILYQCISTTVRVWPRKVGVLVNVYGPQPECGCANRRHSTLCFPYSCLRWCWVMIMLNAAHDMPSLDWCTKSMWAADDDVWFIEYSQSLLWVWVESEFQAALRSAQPRMQATTCPGQILELPRKNMCLWGQRCILWDLLHRGTRGVSSWHRRHFFAPDQYMELAFFYTRAKSHHDTDGDQFWEIHILTDGVSYNAASILSLQQCGCICQCHGLFFFFFFF